MILILCSMFNLYFKSIYTIIFNNSEILFATKVIMTSTYNVIVHKSYVSNTFVPFL